MISRLPTDYERAELHERRRATYAQCAVIAAVWLAVAVWAVAC